MSNKNKGTYSLTSAHKNNKPLKKEQSKFTKNRKRQSAKNQAFKCNFQLDQSKITKLAPVSIDTGTTWFSVNSLNNNYSFVP